KDPAWLSAVKASETWPLPSVVPVMVVPLLLNVPLAPVIAGAVKVTTTPETGLLPASRTVTTSALPKAVLMVALWGVPEVAAMLAGVPAVLVRLKEAGPWLHDALPILKDPAWLSAVKASETWPLPSVVPVMVVPLLLNVPLAPVVAGAAK